MITPSAATCRPKQAGGILCMWLAADAGGLVSRIVTLTRYLMARTQAAECQRQRQLSNS
jgi:hypothetical protein